jgi:SAM-dependent methyltransferase
MVVVDPQNTDCPPTEIVPQCPLCGGFEIEPMFSIRDHLHRLPGEFALVRCSRCSLVRLSPRPVIAQLDFYYPDDYFSYQIPVSLSLSSATDWRSRLKTLIRNSVMAWKGYPIPNPRPWQRALQPLFITLFRRRIPYGFGESFPRYVPGGRALEIGCGSGAFLGLLNHYGWQVTGVEINETVAATASRELGIEVFAGDWRAAPYAAESFDYVHLRHVIEHLPEPLDVLRAIARWLKPGGVVYIETPNLDSFACKQLERYWTYWDAPRHLYLFSPATLAQAAATAGLAVKKLSTTIEANYLWAEVFRREAREQRPIPNRPPFPSQPELGTYAGLRHKAFRLAARLTHLYRPLNGDNLCCWATKL